MVAVGLVSRIEIESVERAKRADPADLAKMVEFDPEQPVVDQARLMESGIAVWAIVNHTETFVEGEIGGDVDAAAIVQTARDYMIPVMEVVAALEYYRMHRAAIDAWRERERNIHEALAAPARPVFG
jgi:hypothetical protein